ncbi:hypothetical protein IQ273_30310 [Nodosilinea sp. LEGE 07298]|uniref:hypothetical protein n=1 Tax=Nodosilinea sp. LEGE 07298 TaxID=2777970 RepID=UPI00187F66FB|nr:hypothetical protein [Nodosilinea sp. LEGE 07298]MBE9113670.1 hypothetical protein [Nodosilinea sp. LEGE 07298]
MANSQSSQETNLSDSVAQNPGARKVATKNNPKIGQEEARNANAGEGPNAAGGETPSTAEDHVPAESSPEASDLPTANRPNPEQTESK